MMKPILAFFAALLFQAFLMAQSDTSQSPVETDEPSQKEAFQKNDFFEIQYILPDDESGKINLYMKALDDRGASELNTENKKLYTVRRDHNETVKKFKSNTIEVNVPTQAELDEIFENADSTEIVVPTPPTILILLDMSGSMGWHHEKGEKEKRPEDEPNRLDKAKEAIAALLENPKVKSAKLQFATFGDEVSSTVPLDLSFVNNLEIDYSKHTVLNEAIYKKAQELSRQKGEGAKALIIFSDGENDDSHINRSERILNDSVFARVSKLDSKLHIFPIGIGESSDKEFLSAIADTSPSPLDAFTLNQPSELSKALGETVKKLGTQLKITLPADTTKYGSEDATFIVDYRNRANDQFYSAQKTRALGSTWDVFFAFPQTLSVWQILAIGIVVLLVLLAILMLLVPLIGDFLFRQRYFKTYKNVKTARVTRYDPYSQTPFTDNDQVVAMNNKVMLVDTWKYLKSTGEGQTSKEYSEFFAGTSNQGFFSQSGVFKKLNWLWFGVLGGLLAYALNLFFANFSGMVDALEPLTKSVFNLKATEKGIAVGLAKKVLLGAALGLAMSLAFSIVEELGQSRRVKIFRIFLRVLIGTVLGGLLFPFLEYINLEYIDHPYFGPLVVMTSLGILLGLVLTFFSSIELKSGIIGGAVAGVVGFHLYFLFTELEMDPRLSQMLSLMAYGGVLGYVLYAVVERIEDFALEYVSPAQFSGQVKPISKWLKSSGGNIDFIYIGKNPDSEVYVKWDDDTVAGHHAKLSYEKGAVFIEPFEGDVLINGSNARGKTALKDRDEILLGPNSVSIMRFLGKKAQSQVG